ncbi:transglycosylase SLT domain-containing protein [Curvibacter sp. HBC28]|uniref:Transglycosylase SLT domain-containing protein n=1 Tax=Curvibacter microcysteis TaxID=3026419 RepID=A0ABT5MA83_9BURK|nr:lytic transglycosylase domain-containing protein [Curvibacter sp. HBC28]MDD0813500.1 transglycosylase SLT domain-containing protein [Curvibacter sp. HBC28]
MYLQKILTSVLACVAIGSFSGLATAQNRGDDVVLDMSQAFRKGDRKKLSQLLPQARGHALEPWAAYWELRARLGDASSDEVEAFLARYVGTYQEDRLRNDWLLLLGQRRDWAGFAAQYPLYRMGDDREVKCYGLLVEQLKGQATPQMADEVRRLWYSLREADDGCTQAADRLYANKRLTATDLWRKARLATEANRPRAARNAVELVAPDALGELAQLNDSPVKFLAKRVAAPTRVRQELVVLALIKIAQTDPDAAANLLDTRWGVHLLPEEQHWVLGVIGKQLAMKLDSDAVRVFAKVNRDSDLNDDLLGWKVRAALRASQWRLALNALRAMSDEGSRDPTWVYWRARAQLALARTDEARQEALQPLQAIAGARGFYEQLAMEELGQRITLPPRPVPLSAEEKDAARNHPGLNRALYAIALGLRSEGNREWNYTTNLHSPGGMGDRELLAAADFACQREVWDRCINTSERTRNTADYEQRYPMPFRDQVLRRSRDIGLDPAYVYGLIRQESRFVMDARSGVGASGLMQVMPATARWTAKKIGLNSFTPDQLSERDTNITIGTAYLKLALDDFGGSMPMAAAAYNAGPGRPRNWRNGPVLDAAIWAENIPFNETRDYVKKVLANTTAYAALITGQPQSLKGRLGSVGPRDERIPEPNADLP